MAEQDDPLAVFDARVAAWFRGTYGEPTDAQRRAWPRIAAGEHVLLTAPTGSGKTLAAFLWALERLLTGAWPNGATRVLYVSPLKALNTDVRRNLLEPLAALAAVWRSAGREPPEIRVQTRSGDTPQDERARMARRPPEILITTPESLNILLTSKRGRAMLSGLECVILDEVHAVVGSKRGVHLITAVERLVRLSGEVQRIALSATVRPLERVARWVGGFSLDGPQPAPRSARRPVAVVAAADPRRVELTVRYPGAAVDPGADDAAPPDELWASVVAELRRTLGRNHSTLVFADSRRMVEKLTRLVNDEVGHELVYSHHGSLSREIRAVVEERLKQGELAGIVATSSLELGIDIGALDEVVLVQPPPSVAAAVQRIGRSGHAVGATSRGAVVALVPRDLVSAAVLARAALAGEIEAVRPVAGALDVLAQVLVSLCCGERWPVDELYAEIRRSEPYHDLPRSAFDLVVEMLAGRYATTRIRELRPLLSVDRVDGTVGARPGADRTVYMSGGTIPDRGTFRLRLADSGALLGELDEEFVWERSIGDTFTLGTRGWRIERVTHNDVFVRPSHGHAAMAPFWRAEERDRPFELAARIGEFLEQADTALDDPGFAPRLERDHAMDPAAARALVAFLRRQRDATAGLPHRHRLVAESVADPQGDRGVLQLVLHTGWGGRVNRPFAMALQQAWEDRRGVPLEVAHDDDCVTVASAGELDAAELLSLVTSANLDALLRARVERSGFFGARFREAAGRALLLPREGFARRTPLWLSRQRAKDLLEAVSGFDDFPLVLEAWRTCLADEFDLEALRLVLDELSEGRIAVARVRSDAPSPFASGVVWKRTNQLMYEDDTPSGGPSRLRGDLLRELVFASHLRPRLPRELVERFTAKLRRTHPGYAPRDARELLDWLVERVVIPMDEWRELLAAVRRDHGADVEALVAALDGKAVALTPPGAGRASCVVALESVPRVLAAAGHEPGAVRLRPLAGAAVASEPPGVTAPAPDAGPDPLAELFAELLRFSGPVPPETLTGPLGVDPARAADALEQLVDTERAVVDDLTDDAEAPQVCDAENLERLLRLARAAARPELEPLPADRLPLFLADWQRLGVAGAGAADLRAALEPLLGFAAPAELWESELLPARLDPYHPDWLDALMADTGLRWLGCGEGRLAFVLADGRELIGESARQPAGERAEIASPPAGARNDKGAGARNDREVGARDGTEVGARSGTGAGARPDGEETGADSLADLFPAGGGRYTLEELAARTGRGTTELAAALWRLAWRGEAAADTFAVVRRGIESGFRPAQPQPTATARRPTGRLRFDRWQASRPFGGGWFTLPAIEPPGDALDAAELDKERARLVLDRYGVVFRELLEREPAVLRWGRLFRALRLMELSGEVVAGQFFTGRGGLQFASHEALQSLRDGLAGDRVWWVNAADPASPCGLGIEELGELPRRIAGHHLVFHGARVVVVSERRGKALDIRAAADHPRLDDYLGFLRAMLGRSVRHVRAISVETVNHEPAAASPYRPVLERLFHVTRDRDGLRLGRRY